MALGATIAEVTREWPRDVELAIFGTREPDDVAALVDAFCTSVLGSRIRRYRFYKVSIASVHGVELVDGRVVVIKAHQPRVVRERLEGVVTVQRSLADAGFPSPRPLVGPLPLAHGNATVETALEGRWHDGHDPAFRRAMAATLYELVARCSGVDAPGIPIDHLLTLPPRDLWPHPHSTVFDFDATREGAEGIDGAGRAAREILDRAGTEGVVIGHTDWRAENLRFDGGRIVAVYDWESLQRTHEPMLVGGAAFAFTADWSMAPTTTQSPTLDEVRAFVTEYEEARGTPFDRAERGLLGATYLFGTAYVARCCHARDPSGQLEATDGFRTLIDEHGAELIRVVM